MLFEQVLKDTSSDVEKIQIGLLRQAGQTRRTQLMLSLTQSMFALSWHNLQNAHPQLSEQEQKIKFVELLYGPSLAKAFQDFLQAENGV